MVCTIQVTSDYIDASHRGIWIITLSQIYRWMCQWVLASLNGNFALKSVLGLTSNRLALACWCLQTKLFGNLQSYAYTGWHNKNRTFFEIPNFCSHYRYNHAVFSCWSVQKLQQKTTSDNFFKRVLNILCKLVKIWYLVNVSAIRL